MRTARRQLRAVPASRQAVNGRRLAEVMSLLYSDTPTTPEQAAALQVELAAPRTQRQCDLPLCIPEPDSK
jgi:hypothetical protein